MLIDKSYFLTGPLMIPQLNTKAVNDHLTQVVNRYETQILEAALGYDLSDAYEEGRDVGSDEVVDAKWGNLTDGLLFTDRGSSRQRWKGFANEETKQSVLAAFIWCYFMEERAYQQVGIGTVVNEAENATVVSPATDICRVWNEACRDIKVLWEYLDKNILEYPAYKNHFVNQRFFRPKNIHGI